MQDELDQKDRTIRELKMQLDESLTLNEKFNSENKAGNIQALKDDLRKTKELLQSEKEKMLTAQAMIEECRDKLRQAEQERDYAFSHQKKAEIPVEKPVLYQKCQNCNQTAYLKAKEKKTLRLGDLLHLKEESVQNRLKMMLEAKNLELAGCYYQEPMSYPALLSWCEAQAAELWPYIVDTGAYLEEALKEGKRVVLEAQLGAMRDIDYGIFPYTSSSSTISAYGPIGAGIPGKQLDHVVGVLKAYSTCVGAGPFTAEKAMPESWMELLRKFGGEYGAATGRPRRVGPFDAVASRYGLKCQNADKIALTKLDVLSMMKEIPVIVGYKKGNQEVTDFDPIEDLEEYVPIVRMLPGWQTDISGCVTYDELPDAAKTYVETLEDLLQHEIQFISVGAERSQYLTKGEWL